MLVLCLCMYELWMSGGKGGILGHKVSGIWGCEAFSVCCRVFYCCHRSTTGSHEIDYYGTPLVADHSHRVCYTPTHHIARWELEVCVHSSSSGKLCLCSENHFSPQDK